MQRQRQDIGGIAISYLCVSRCDVRSAGNFTSDSLFILIFVETGSLFPFAKSFEGHVNVLLEALWVGKSICQECTLCLALWWFQIADDFVPARNSLKANFCRSQPRRTSRYWCDSCSSVVNLWPASDHRWHTGHGPQCGEVQPCTKFWSDAAGKGTRLIVDVLFWTLDMQVGSMRSEVWLKHVGLLGIFDWKCLVAGVWSSCWWGTSVQGQYKTELLAYLIRSLMILADFAMKSCGLCRFDDWMFQHLKTERKLPWPWSDRIKHHGPLPAFRAKQRQVPRLPPVRRALKSSAGFLLVRNLIRCQVWICGSWAWHGIALVKINIPKVTSVACSKIPNFNVLPATGNYKSWGNL